MRNEPKRDQADYPRALAERAAAAIIARDQAIAERDEAIEERDSCCNFWSAWATR
jgi:hypothetical protein